MTITTPLLAAGTAFVAGVPLVWLARAAAKRTGFVAHPNPIVASHRSPVPYLGGAAIAVAMLLAGAFVRPALGTAAVLPGLAFLLLGLADDRRAFAAAPKFALQVAAAGCAVAAGARAPLTGMPIADAMLSGLWILVLVNAFNFVDVCDGLLAGVALVFFAFAAIAIPQGRDLAALAAGATLALLTANRPPAKIYLGDAGSHLLGFVVAWLCLAPGPHAVGMTRAAWALAVPLAELVFITAVRIAKGLPWWKGSPDHFALRLQARGWGAWRVDLCAWSAAAAFAAVGVAWPALGAVPRLVVAGAAAVSLAVIAHDLLRPERRARG